MKAVAIALCGLAVASMGGCELGVFFPPFVVPGYDEVIVEDGYYYDEYYYEDYYYDGYYYEDVYYEDGYYEDGFYGGFYYEDWGDDYEIEIEDGEIEIDD